MIFSSSKVIKGIYPKHFLYVFYVLNSKLHMYNEFIATFYLIGIITNCVNSTIFTFFLTYISSTTERKAILAKSHIMVVLEG